MNEIVFAKEKRSTVSLGKRILRTETAGPALSEFLDIVRGLKLINF